MALLPVNDRPNVAILDRWFGCRERRRTCINAAPSVGVYPQRYIERLNRLRAR
jgi:hypothetical protein